LLAAWQDWLLSHSIAILNIAGPSEARNPGIYLQASALLELFWSKEHEPI
ncbi:TPA: molybdenum cofactor carrier, partial [Pseudomonas aeruginosa]|nr:molybdenum cofactor carrier [Pseudomonas aeruginosa]HCF6198894.1 molybdenum cofactor carrier [Pseudomonas aeruginosa]